MRRARFIVEGAAFYHCVFRVVDQANMMSDKRPFRYPVGGSIV